MKKTIGIVIIFLSTVLIGIIMLRVWNIEIVSLENIVKSTATLVLLVLAIVIFIIIYYALVKNNNQVYNKKMGNKAHPKQ